MSVRGETRIDFASDDHPQAVKILVVDVSVRRDHPIVDGK